MSNQEDNSLLDYINYTLVSGLLKIYFKFVIVAIIILACSIFLFSIINNSVSENQKKEEAKEYSNSIQIESQDKIIQAKINIKGLDYYLPIKPDLTKAQKLMLMGIRIPEWENRSDISLDGDLDSFCPYQQRASEIMNNNAFKSTVSKYLDISKVFTKDRVSYLNLFKNSQLRNKASFVVTFGYGVSHPFTGVHKGVDLGYNFEDVVSPLDGVVSNVTWDNGGGGKVVIVNHEKEGIRTLYAHLSSFNVSIGQKVKAGEIIAISGNSSSYSLGSHLHFQIINGLTGEWNSSTQDPTLQRNMYDIMLNKYISLSQNLISVHLRTGMCDDLALTRLQGEKSMINWLNREDIKFEELPSLVHSLCLSQRPVDCGVWELRSLIVLEQLFDKIK